MSDRYPTLCHSDIGAPSTLTSGGSGSPNPTIFDLKDPERTRDYIILTSTPGLTDVLTPRTLKPLKSFVLDQTPSIFRPTMDEEEQFADYPNISVIKTPDYASQTQATSATHLAMLGTTSNDTLMLLIQTMQQQMKQDREQQQQHTAQLVAAVTEAMKEKKNHQPPKLPLIRGDKSVERDLHQFEQHMETYEIPKKLWAAELRPLLTEEALAAHRQILPADILTIMRP